MTIHRHPFMHFKFGWSCIILFEVSVSEMQGPLSFLVLPPLFSNGLVNPGDIAVLIRTSFLLSLSTAFLEHQFIHSHQQAEPQTSLCNIPFHSQAALLNC